MKLTECMECFDGLVGMDALKESISDMLKFIICVGHSQDHFLNVVLTGPPGTGKTTVAKTLFRVFNMLDVFGDVDQKLTVLTRSDLVGNYLGQSCNKTKKVLDACKGGVVFIDEFYSLLEGRDDYGRQVLHTLNAFIGENPDTIFIVAGYAKMMEPIYEAQPGLRRRFPWNFHIDDYSAKQLFKIFRQQLKAHKWKVRHPKQVLKLFETNRAKLTHFGGDCHNIAFRSKLLYAKRNWLYPKCDRRLETDDVRAAMEQLLRRKAQQTQESPPCESMYL